MKIRSVLIPVLSVTLSSLQSWACPVDQFNIKELRFSPEEIACSPGSGQRIRLPGLMIKGQINSQDEFSLCVSDAYLAGALLTVMLNPYYGLTEHDMNRVQGRAGFKIDPERAVELATSAKRALELLSVNPAFLKLQASADLISAIDPTADAAEVNEQLKKFADLLGEDIRGFFKEAGSIWWHPVTIDGFTMFMSSASGRSLLPPGYSYFRSGEYEVFNNADLNNPDFNIVYASKNIVEALFKTASLGAGGVRGIMKSEEVRLSNAQKKRVSKLVSATKTQSCMVSLNLPKGSNPLQAVADYVDYLAPGKIGGSVSDRSKAKAEKSNRAPAQNQKQK